MRNVTKYGKEIIILQNPEDHKWDIALRSSVHCVNAIKDTVINLQWLVAGIIKDKTPCNNPPPPPPPPPTPHTHTHTHTHTSRNDGFYSNADIKQFIDHAWMTNQDATTGLFDKYEIAKWRSINIGSAQSYLEQQVERCHCVKILHM